MNAQASPAHPIRMLAIDLDGTLLRADRTVSPRTAQALRAVNQKGITVVLASGRMTPAMEPAAAALGFDVCLVSYNGAVICSNRAEGRRRIFHQPLKRDVARDLFQIARRDRMQINYYHNDVIVSEDAPHLLPYIDIYRSRTGSPYNLVSNLEEWLHHEPTKVLFVVDANKRDALQARLTPQFSSRATIIPTDPEYLEFLDPSVNKGSGVIQLAARFGIGLQNVMAIGDGANDVPMFQAAGFSVAVANAGAPARTAAHVITERDHDNDAVAEAVERWIL